MISFVIVTHDSEKHIRDCLNHIMAVSDISYEIIVVDNDSKDNTRQIVKDEFESVKLIESKENLGFAHGVNTGVHHAKQSTIFLLNPDARILPSNLRDSAAFISSNHVGVLGPRVINPHDFSRQFSARRFPTLRTGIFNRSSIFTSLVPNNRFSREYLNPIVSDDRPQQIDWVSGCAMVFRKEVFDLVGGFDDNFFVFYEDIDFCYRLKEAGYKVVYNPMLLVSHEIGISKTVPTLRINYERHRGMWLYYTKHFQRKRLIDLFVICGIALRFIITSIKVLVKKIIR
jgi:GT2 family glycosyltransferase